MNSQLYCPINDCLKEDDSLMKYKVKFWKIFTPKFYTAVKWTSFVVFWPFDCCTWWDVIIKWTLKNETTYYISRTRERLISDGHMEII